MRLFDFDGDDAARWEIENDGVMGGRSRGFVEVSDGALVFTGEVVTEGGGFTSVRAVEDLDAWRLCLGRDDTGRPGQALRPPEDVAVGAVGVCVV